MQSEEDCKLKLQKLEDYVHQLQLSKVGVVYSSMMKFFYMHTTPIV